jgi:hypothetical protein
MGVDLPTGSVLPNARTMRAQDTHIHTHSKWGRMVETLVRSPARKARRLAERVKAQAVKLEARPATLEAQTVRLEELTPEMLAQEHPPTIETTQEQAEDLSRLAAHGAGSH